MAFPKNYMHREYLAWCATMLSQSIYFFFDIPVYLLLNLIAF
jgi:hypothetical protein